jgi:hypothetical protein
MNNLASLHLLIETQAHCTSGAARRTKFSSLLKSLFSTGGGLFRPRRKTSAGRSCSPHPPHGVRLRGKCSDRGTVITYGRCGFQVQTRSFTGMRERGNVPFYYGGGLYPTTSPKWRRAARALVHAPHSLRESPPPHPHPPTSFIKSSTSSTSHHMSEHESVHSPVCFGGAGVPREAKCFIY